jgi:hypothetical protein
MSRRFRYARAAFVVLACLAIEGAVAQVAATTVARGVDALGSSGTDPRAVADLVAALAAAALVCGWTWLAGAALVTTADALRARDAVVRQRAGVPAAWHRWVVGVVGAGLLCTPAAASGAGDADAPGADVAGAAAPAGRLDGLPLPDRPVAGIGREVHRVAPGECLWSVAAGRLGPDASDAEIARAWPRWYAANRPVIGDDPDRLLPGTVLRAPAAPAGTGAPSRQGDRHPHQHESRNEQDDPPGTAPEP